MSAPIPQAAFQNGADGREVLNRSEAVWTQKEKEYAVGGFLAGMTYAEIADEFWGAPRETYPQLAHENLRPAFARVFVRGFQWGVLLQMLAAAIVRLVLLRAGWL